MTPSAWPKTSRSGRCWRSFPSLSSRALADPEGNGIEVYVDRPTTGWRDGSGEIRMTTEPLEVEDLLKAAGGTGSAGLPEQGSIGHVHLQVGDIEAADQFYRDVLAFAIAARYPDASFFGSGGYHHQLAGNVWGSRNPGRGPEGMAGLDRVEIAFRNATEISNIIPRAESAGIAHTESRGATILRDPWSFVFRLLAGAPAD